MVMRLFIRTARAALTVAALSTGAVSAVALMPLAQAQDKWPERAVTFIVPFPPGGPVDTTARLTAQSLAQLWSVGLAIYQGWQNSCLRRG